METAEMIADSLQHKLYKGGYYTMKQKSEALEECVEANVTIEQLWSAGLDWNCAGHSA